MTRQPHPTDRRAFLVSLTEHGAAMVKGMEEGQQELAHMLFAQMRPEQLDCFTRGLGSILDRLRAGLRASDEWGPMWMIGFLASLPRRAGRSPAHDHVDFAADDACKVDMIMGREVAPAELLRSVWLVPTPGHTTGHQWLIVRRRDGAVILAGQSHDTA